MYSEYRPCTAQTYQTFPIHAPRRCTVRASCKNGCLATGVQRKNTAKDAIQAAVPIDLDVHHTPYQQMRPVSLESNPRRIKPTTFNQNNQRAREMSKPWRDINQRVRTNKPEKRDRYNALKEHHDQKQNFPFCNSSRARGPSQPPT